MASKYESELSEAKREHIRQRDREKELHQEQTKQLKQEHEQKLRELTREVNDYCIHT